MIPQFNFYLKDIHSKTATLIYLQSRFNYERLMLTCGERILPVHWDFENKRAIVKYNRLEYPSINDWLDKIEMAAKDHFRDCRLQGVFPTAANIKAHLESKFNLNPKPVIENQPTQPMLIEFVDKFIANETGKKARGSIQAYNTCRKHLAGYCAFYNKKDLHFDEINADFYDSYISYLNSLNFAKNTVGKQVKTLKVFLNSSVDRGINTNQFFKSKMFKKPTEEVDKIYITDEEIERIYKLNLGGEGSLETTRDLFIIACYTGFRFSDFSTLTKEHINDNYIIKKTLKTKTKVVIPIHPVVREILEKYQYTFPQSLTNAYANNRLKSIAKRAKLNDDIEIIKTIGGKPFRKVYKKWQLVCTHTARRSFATNAYLAGVPTISIMYITGHATESVFMQYISIDELKNAEHIQSHAFFNAKNFIPAA
jgi:integrase